MYTLLYAAYNRLQNMKGIKHFTGLKKLYLSIYDNNKIKKIGTIHQKDNNKIKRKLILFIRKIIIKRRRLILCDYMYYRDENNEKSDTVQMWDDDIQREYKVKRDLMRERDILCI